MTLEASVLRMDVDGVMESMESVARVFRGGRRYGKKCRAVTWDCANEGAAAVGSYFANEGAAVVSEGAILLPATTAKPCIPLDEFVRPFVRSSFVIEVFFFLPQVLEYRLGLKSHSFVSILPSPVCTSYEWRYGKCRSCFVSAVG